LLYDDRLRIIVAISHWSFQVFLEPNVNRRIAFGFDVGLVGDVVVGEDDWLLRLLDEEKEDVEFDRDRLSERISSRLTLFLLSKTSLSSSMCSVNFDLTILMIDELLGSIKGCIVGCDSNTRFKAPKGVGMGNS